MGRVQRQVLSEQVVQYYENVANHDKFKTVSYFREQGYKSRGLYYIIKRYEEKGSSAFEPIPGRPVTVATKLMCNKVRKRNVYEPYIKIGSMNAEEYRTECIEKRLIPFIEKYHKTEEVIFWPDMARIHYSKVVKDCLETHNIEFIEWHNNAPAVPQARPIEQFWSNCKRIYSKRSGVPNDLKTFVKVWKDISDFVHKNYAQALTADFRKVLKNIGDNGVYGTFKK